MIPGIGRIALATLAAAWVSIVVDAHAFDLTGTWAMKQRGFAPLLVPVVQTGSDLTILDLDGNVSVGSPFSTYFVDRGGVTVPYVTLSGRIMPSATMMDGTGGGSTSPSSRSSVTLTRCNCDDGNTASGDGCSAECRVEPCWTCSGTPSACTPSAHGASCNDYDPCTSGETCSAGACTGAAVPACVVLRGRWLRHRVLAGVGEEDIVGQFDQFDSDVIAVVPTFEDEPTRGELVGTMNPASGAFELRRSYNGPTWQNCPQGGWDTLIGTVAADNQTYVASGVLNVLGPTNICTSVNVTETGTLLTTTSTTVTTSTSTSSTTTSSTSTTTTSSSITTTSSTTSTSSSTSSSSTSTSSSATTTTSTSTTLPFGAFCPSAPLTGCRRPTAPRKAKLTITDRSLDLADSLTWKWTKGAATAPSDLGDPTTTTDYSACLYDGDGTLQMTLRMPAGGTCWGTSCWKATAKGFVYGDKDGSPDGVTKLSIVAGAEGRAKLSLTAKGDALPMPPLGGMPLPLRFQLHGNDQCWEAVYSDPDDDSALRFKAASD